MKTPRLFHNVATLGGVQIANFMLTLVMIPYVTRILGVEQWGRVVFIQLVINYFIWFCNWGYYLSGTRKIAEHRADEKTLSNVFMATYFSQWVFTLIAIVFISLMMFFVPFMAKDKTLYIYGIGLLLGNVLMPFWFLNGIERIAIVGVIQIIAKIISIPLIFLFVRDSGDAHLYIAANAAGAILMGFYTLFWIRKNVIHSYSIPSWHDMYIEVKESSSLFVSTLLASLSGAVVPTALGIIAGPVALGYYNLADRARGAAITITQPISHALFPRMCHLFSMDIEKAKVFLKHSSIVLFSISFSTSSMLFIFADEILFVLGGKEFSAAADSLRWLALTPFLTTISGFFLHQIIIPAKKAMFYQISIFLTLLLALALVVPAINLYQAEGAAMVVFVTELFFMSIMLVYLMKNRFFLTKSAR